MRRLRGAEPCTGIKKRWKLARTHRCCFYLLFQAHQPFNPSTNLWPVLPFHALTCCKEAQTWLAKSSGVSMGLGFVEGFLVFALLVWGHLVETGVLAAGLTARPTQDFISPSLQLQLPPTTTTPTYNSSLSPSPPLHGYPISQLDWAG